MKRIMYATIAVFVGILIIAMVVAERNPVHSVKYVDGTVVDDNQ